MTAPTTIGASAPDRAPAQATGKGVTSSLALPAPNSAAGAQVPAASFGEIR